MDTINIPIATTEDYEEYMINKNLCPNCEQLLEQVVEEDTDAVLGVYCDICQWQMEF